MALCTAWGPPPAHRPCQGVMHACRTECPICRCAMSWVLHACRTECPVCAEPYLMQAVDHPERARYNRSPKWEVPLELIEWQPSFTQQVTMGDFGL